MNLGVLPGEEQKDSPHLSMKETKKEATHFSYLLGIFHNIFSYTIFSS